MADIALRAIPAFQIAPNELGIVASDDFMMDTQRAAVALSAGQAVRYDPGTGDWQLADANLFASVLTMTGAATAAGNILVNPGGIAAVSVALAATDTAAGAATRIAAATYPGFTAAANGAVVTFTAISGNAGGPPSVTAVPAGFGASFAAPTGGNNRVFGLVTRSVQIGEYVTAVQKGLLDGFDFTPQSYGASIFLSATAGGIADAAPTAAGIATIVVGRVVPVRSQTRGNAPDKLLKLDVNLGTALAA